MDALPIALAIHHRFESIVTSLETDHDDSGIQQADRAERLIVLGALSAACLLLHDVQKELHTERATQRRQLLL